MRRLVLLLAAVALSPTAGAAAAGPAAVARFPLPVDALGVRIGGYVTGPLVAGDQVVFGTMAVNATQPARLFAAPASGGGAARPLPGPATVFGAGAAGILARAEVHVADGGPRMNDYVSSERLVAGPLDGPQTELSRCLGPAAADGASVAYIGGDRCDAIVVRDLIAGAEAGRFPRGDPPPYYASGPVLRLSGTSVAWRSAGDLNVGDLRTGAVRSEPWPSSATDYAVARDGSVAYVLREDGAFRLMLRPADGAPRTTAVWPAPQGWIQLLGFSGDDVAVRLALEPPAPEAVSARIDLVAPDGAARTLLRSRPVLWNRVVPTPGQDLLGADVEDGRIAWMLEDCDEAVVTAADIADVPAGGVDATAPVRCVRPVVESTRVVLDRRGRGTIAVRCPAACSGTLLLSDPARQGGARTLARRTVALGAGRHRIAVRVREVARARIARAQGRRVAGYVTLTGTTGGRPSTGKGGIAVVAARGGAERQRGT